jgi:hypothetical protein
MFTLHVPKATLVRCTVHRRVANRSQAVICTSMQGFFPDRGDLGRQGRDTDASNGEVGAVDRCWDQSAV